MYHKGRKDGVVKLRERETTAGFLMQVVEGNKCVGNQLWQLVNVNKCQQSGRQPLEGKEMDSSGPRTVELVQFF